MCVIAVAISHLPIHFHGSILNFGEIVRRWGSPVQIQRHEPRPLGLVPVGVEEHAPLGHAVQPYVQLRLGGAQHQLGRGIDLGEVRDPHHKRVFLTQGIYSQHGMETLKGDTHLAAGGRVDVGVGGGGPGAPEHDPGGGLGQVPVLGQVLRPIGEDAVIVLQRRHGLHHPPVTCHLSGLITCRHYSSCHDMYLLQYHEFSHNLMSEKIFLKGC